MFGLNDDSTQNTDANNAAQPPAPMMQSNPFGDTSPPGPAPDSLPQAEPSALPSSLPQDMPKEPAVPGAAGNAGEDDLLQLKEQALHSLQPLVSHLDQTPEEKFKTTMMMIQATDNPSLVKDAYQAANQIPDEKSRAQALLDVVNEINYFTQHSGEAGTKV